MISYESKQDLMVKHQMQSQKDKLSQLQSSYLVHICICMIVVGVSHSCVTLTDMSQLTVVFATVFKAKVLVLMDTFETMDFILG